MIWKNFALHCLSPESYELRNMLGRSPDLPNFYQPSHPKGQWQREWIEAFFRLTVAGTATDLHRIPF